MSTVMVNHGNQTSAAVSETSAPAASGSRRSRQYGRGDGRTASEEPRLLLPSRHEIERKNFLVALRGYDTRQELEAARARRVKAEKEAAELPLRARDAVLAASEQVQGADAAETCKAAGEQTTSMTHGLQSEPGDVRELRARADREVAELRAQVENVRAQAENDTAELRGRVAETLTRLVVTTETDPEPALQPGPAAEHKVRALLGVDVGEPSATAEGGQGRQPSHPLPAVTRSHP